ncbi:MAG: hypothetical protein DWQ05_07555 [Calditrichaeota bacterium]|nr:MAG: hypothetical protein DWQ05_07555 [Calditrichota bacterium]
MKLLLKMFFLVPIFFSIILGQTVRFEKVQEINKSRIPLEVNRNIDYSLGERLRINNRIFSENGEIYAQFIREEMYLAEETSISSISLNKIDGTSLGSYNNLIGSLYLTNNNNQIVTFSEMADKLRFYADNNSEPVNTYTIMRKDELKISDGGNHVLVSRTNSFETILINFNINGLMNWQTVLPNSLPHTIAISPNGEFTLASVRLLNPEKVGLRKEYKDKYRQALNDFKQKRRANGEFPRGRIDHLFAEPEELKMLKMTIGGMSTFAGWKLYLIDGNGSILDEIDGFYKFENLIFSNLDKTKFFCTKGNEFLVKNLNTLQNMNLLKIENCGEIFSSSINAKDELVFIYSDMAKLVGSNKRYKFGGLNLLFLDPEKNIRVNTKLKDAPPISSNIRVKFDIDTNVVNAKYDDKFTTFRIIKDN